MFMRVCLLSVAAISLVLCLETNCLGQSPISDGKSQHVLAHSSSNPNNIVASSNIDVQEDGDILERKLERLFDGCCWMQLRGLQAGGAIAQGFTWNPDSPADRSNGTLAFNDELRRTLAEHREDE